MTEYQKLRLNEIACMLLGAGSDDGFTQLNRFDTELLGLIGCKDKVKIMVHPPVMQGYLTANMPDPTPKEQTVNAVEGIRLTEDADEVFKAFKVHNGTARKACDKLMGGRTPQGLRMKDVPAPNPEPEGEPAVA